MGRVGKLEGETDVSRFCWDDIYEILRDLERTYALR